jgi:hypothetical protein
VVIGERKSLDIDHWGKIDGERMRSAAASIAAGKNLDLPPQNSGKKIRKFKKNRIIY